MKKLFMLASAFMLALNLNAVNVWDGTSEPWTKGSGTASDPYLIETASNLAYLAEKVNEGYQAEGMEVFAHVYFLMTDDLDLNHLNWTPIGNVDYVNEVLSGYYFAGVFDGWYHTISNLRIQTSANITGLFAALGGTQGPPPSDGGGRVQHLAVDNGDITSTGLGAGGVVGVMAGDASVYQCNFSGTINVSNSGDFCGGGGIVAVAAQNSGVRECCFSGSITATNSNFMGAAGCGGIVGVAINEASIQKCYNAGSVAGNAMMLSVAAGIVAATMEENNVTIGSCYNVGSLNAITKGGIFGMVSPVNPFKGETEIDVYNCFYLNTCGGTTAYGTSMTADQMRTESFKNQLDQSAHAFVMDNGSNNGYPIHGLTSFRYLPVTDITDHSAKLSAHIHQGNDTLARAYFTYKQWEADEWIEVDVPIDGYVEVVLEDLEPETYYEYGLTLVFADNIFMSSGPMGFQTAIYDDLADFSGVVRVYPNPATDHVNIEGVDVVVAQVYNVTGQLVRTAKDSNTIDVSDLQAGVYFLLISDGDGVVIQTRFLR